MPTHIDYNANRHNNNNNNNPNPWLVATSLPFLIPATLFAIQGNWLLYASNLAVVTVSTMYHASKWTPLYLATANQLAILHTLYAIQKGVWTIPVPGILYSMLMFIYGHKYGCFVWHSSYEVATAWHMYVSSHRLETYSVHPLQGMNTSMHLAVMASAVATAMLV